MRASDPNLPGLRCIATALGELRSQVVFVGGAVAGLLVSDPLAAAVRATRDIDAVVDIRRHLFHRLEEQVADCGFRRDATSDVICRWVHADSGLVFDLMPAHSDVLGFSNSWYPYAIHTAMDTDLGEGVAIRLVTAVAFVATKLEAFSSRGRNDALMSHDLEDVLNIVDGREELALELAEAPEDVNGFIRRSFDQLLADEGFRNVLPGLLADPSRTELVLQRMKSMSSNGGL